MVGLSMFDFLWLLFALPIAGALVLLFAGRWMSLQVAGWVASGAVLGAFAVASMSFVSLLGMPPAERSITIVYWEWMSVGAFQVPAAILYDPLSATMALVVTGVGALIHIYS